MVDNTKVIEKKEEICACCGDVINKENESFSTMVCNKFKCKNFADAMGW